MLIDPPAATLCRSPFGVVPGVYGVAIYVDDFDDSVHSILKPEYDTANVHILRVCLIWGYELQPYPLFQVLA